ncbi:MAG: hypothetical protein ABW186_03060 [Rhodanobacteraceae bacterium]
MRHAGVLLAVLVLAGCQTTSRPDAPRRAGAGAPVWSGTFDNHEQVWTAREAQGAANAPHVVVTVESTGNADWTIWRIRLDATPAMDAAWAIRTASDSSGALVMTPYRPLAATPAATSPFDEKQWTPLDACALRSTASTPHRAIADVAACTAIAPGIGASAALLPLAAEREGEWLHIRLYADQARGADVREDAREVRWFAGWAALNGGGPKADAASRDWHMNRDLRIGTEGGRAALVWRDGQPSGYSVVLERLTYREGNRPVLKLSLVEDANRRVFAYAWANPEATAIGLNLGWAQIGLSRDDQPAAASGAPQ